MGAIYHKFGGYYIPQIWGLHTTNLGAIYNEFGGYIQQIWGLYTTNLGLYTTNLGAIYSKFGGYIQRIWGLYTTNLGAIYNKFDVNEIINNYFNYKFLTTTTTTRVTNLNDEKLYKIETEFHSVLRLSQRRRRGIRSSVI